MYCMALKVYTCQEAARGPKTFVNIFCKLLQHNEPSPAYCTVTDISQYRLRFGSSLLYKSVFHLNSLTAQLSHEGRAAVEEGK
jgi:hypothetical protein